MSFLSIVPIHFCERHALLSQLSDCIERTFQRRVHLCIARFDPECSFDASRRQYNSSLLLEQLLSDADDAAAKILGVTSRDLFSPALTYVFGEAQLNGRAAVVSSERLRNEAYGLPRDDALLCARLEKEAIHEIGHTYGLVHCPDGACVMHSSTYAEQIDFKSARFCTACLRSLATRKT